MQHCPNCGAENNDEAQFCAECGTPLDVENEVVEVDDEPTLLSTNINELIEAHKTEIFEGSSDEDDGATIQISSEQMVEAVAEEPEPTSPTVDQAEKGAENAGGSSNGLMSRRNIIIAIVVLLVLCCCFFAILGGVLMAYNQQLQGAMGHLDSLIILSQMFG